MKKELTFIGLGRMGAAMTKHLVEDGYSVHGFDVSEPTRRALVECGVSVHDSIEAAIHAQSVAPKLIWLMVPAKFVDDVIAEVTPHLSAGDTIVDGGNSFFKDSVRRHHDVHEKGIHFIDCGTSGGVDGARFGASLMAGGEKEVVEQYRELFESLAITDGFGHVGGPGAGHFVKMIHNGIEYGMMGAIAEGMNVLHEHKSALTLDMSQVLKPYEHGSIIQSNLMSWLADAYQTDGYLDRIAGEVPRGETEMEMEYVIEHQDVWVLEAALNQRKHTRENPSFIGTLISAMRNQFGGHKTIEK
ncbi:MAG: NADP-dependent phosphogluconate dehydrogenase [Patescibacteria group bacterium]